MQAHVAMHGSRATGEVGRRSDSVGRHGAGDAEEPAVRLGSGWEGRRSPAAKRDAVRPLQERL